MCLQFIDCFIWLVQTGKVVTHILKLSPTTIVNNVLPNNLNYKPQMPIYRSSLKTATYKTITTS